MVPLKLRCRFEDVVGICVKNENRQSRKSEQNACRNRQARRPLLASGRKIMAVNPCTSYKYRPHFVLLHCLLVVLILEKLYEESARLVHPHSHCLLSRHFAPPAV